MTLPSPLALKTTLRKIKNQVLVSTESTAPINHRYWGIKMGAKLYSIATVWCYKWGKSKAISRQISTHHWQTTSQLRKRHITKFANLEIEMMVCTLMITPGLLTQIGTRVTHNKSAAKYISVICWIRRNGTNHTTMSQNKKCPCYPTDHSNG